MLRHLFVRYLCRFHLGDMLEAIKDSPEFKREYMRGIEHLGLGSRAGLLLLIGRALFFSKSRIANGHLNAMEIERFPSHLRRLALGNAFFLAFNVIWFLTWLVQLSLTRPDLIARIINEMQNPFFLFYAGPWIFFAGSHFLKVYLSRYFLGEMIAAVGLNAEYRRLHTVALERIVFCERSHLLIMIGLAVLYKGLGVRNSKLQVYELSFLSRKFKRLAAIKALCTNVWLLWLLVTCPFLVMERL
ncbi:hypothetical protein NJC38_05580 [Pseudomonas sp. 21LCFQ010]|uniref:hypothetical protein n=2 Tax=unclassified Pseudomonas TaxID=196821 RepID=UPI002097F148|nr:hypothetical protein [Pseudomonas sp. 21LCFQ010]MCO8161623.1 hypothetical protein [Pseudomonas sp. 21LCFQ010]